jgi:hypothetical protein
MSSRDLDQEIRPVRLGVESFRRRDGSLRIVSEKRRDLQRHPTIHAGCPIMDRSKKIGSLPEILDGQLEKQRLHRFALVRFLVNGLIIFVTVLDGVIEDGGIRGKPGD